VSVAGKAFTESAALTTAGGQAVVVLSDSNGALFGATFDGSTWATTGPLESSLYPPAAVAFGLAAR
jgi:hypothetical protein